MTSAAIGQMVFFVESLDIPGMAHLAELARVRSLEFEVLMATARVMIHEGK